MSAVLAAIVIFTFHHQTFLVGRNDKNIINRKMRKRYEIKKTVL
jgi:hypothetical protein